MCDLKFGTDSNCKMQYEDFFLERLKLLIVMGKAFIREYPVKSFRRKAVLNNVEQFVFEVTGRNGAYKNISGNSSYLFGRVMPDHFFYERVKLLGLMCKNFAEGNPGGYFRIKALEETIDHIEDFLRIKEIDIPDFKVA